MELPGARLSALVAVAALGLAAFRSCHRTPDRDLVRVRVKISAHGGGP